MIMPPMRFDANAKVQAEPDPRLMMIVRRVRVRPSLVFQGRVEEETNSNGGRDAATSTASANRSENCDAGTGARLRRRPCEVLLSQALVAKRVTRTGANASFPRRLDFLLSQGSGPKLSVRNIPAKTRSCYFCRIRMSSPYPPRTTSQ